MARFIAEIGSNHNRDERRARRLIDECADAAIVERAVRRWGAGHEAGPHNWTPEWLAQTIAACAGHPLDDSTPSDGDGVKLPMAAELHEVPWRTDPSDGMRPLLATRAALRAAAPS